MFKHIFISEAVKIEDIVGISSIGIVTIYCNLNTLPILWDLLP